MSAVAEMIDDATRSRLENFKRKIGGGRLNLYAVMDRRGTMCILVASTCADEALKLCRGFGIDDWELANTSTRRVVRNIVGEEEVVTAFALALPDNHPERRPAKGSANERTRKRRDRRKRQRDRQLATESNG